MAAKKKTTKSARKSVRKKSGNDSAEAESVCFCIMPFGGYFDDYFDAIYQPAIAESGMSAKRADDLYRPSTIVNDIWEYTQAAEVVLADLTGKNPNVFYELGLAHALAKPAILVVNDMDDVPFDLRALRIIEYDKNDPKWGEILHAKIVRSINEVRASPLSSVLPAFLNVDEHNVTAGVSEEDKTLLLLRSDIDILKRELRSIDRGPSHHGRELKPDDARELIREYLMAGVPEPTIVSRLIRRGPPRDWVEHSIEIIRAEISPPNDKG